MLNSERWIEGGHCFSLHNGVQSYKFTPAALAPLSKTVPTRQGSLAARDKADERNVSFAALSVEEFWGQNSEKTLGVVGIYMLPEVPL